MKKRKFRYSYLGFLSLFITILLVVLLAPVQVGGKVGYVIVSGSSMEPNYYKGDLVLTRKADSYDVGDVAAYNNKILAGVVIHRVVDEVFDRYVFQGDNNDFLDRYEPTAEEVIGKEWLHLPKWGLYILELRKPVNFTALLTIFFAFILVPSREETKAGQKKTAPNDIHRGGIMSKKEKTQEMIASLFVVGMLALIVLVISFSNPVTELVNETSSFEHQGSFGYSANSIAGVYDGTTAGTGDPLFFNTSDRMEIGFNYDLKGYPLQNVTGTYRLVAIVQGENGWNRTLEIVPETSFTGLPLSFSGVLVFEEVVEVIKTFESLTDIRSDPYLLLIVPQITFTGNYRTKEVGFNFSPDMRFEVTDKSLELIFNTPEHLNPKEIAITTIEVEQSGKLNFFSVEIPVQTIRWVSIVVFILSAFGVVWLAYKQYQILKAGGAAAVKFEYGDLIAEVSRKPPNKEMTLVEDVMDLVVIARQTREVVLSNHRGKFVYYFVRSGDGYYYSRLDDTVQETVNDDDV